MKTWIAELRISLLAVLTLGVLLCGVYPVTVWIMGRAFFPAKADGSLVQKDGQTVGSALIGQNFSGPGYFHPRPSAAGQGYDAAASGGSNLGPLSKTLVETVGKRVEAYRAENGLPAGTPVPADAVTTSGSGLDPHISPENARLQAARVAKARGASLPAVLALIESQTEGRDLGLFGEPRVNVLALNLALDEGAYVRR
jgi:K+-transporting ATPase ATPase C chain